jgi:hypothetical protein
VLEIARTFLALEDRDPRFPNYHTYVQDGRVFLATTDRRYDVIGIDAYRIPYIPAHLTTREFFQSARDHLTTDGVLAINVTGGIARRLGDSLAATMRAVFPQVFLIDTSAAVNRFIVGVNHPVGDGPAHFVSNYRRMPSAALREVMATAIRSDDTKQSVREWKGQAPIFTDDWAPIEWMVEGGILMKKLPKLLRG